MRVVGLEAMSGASLSGFHAQAARLSALVNTASSSDSEGDGHEDGAFRVSDYARPDAGADGDYAADMQDSFDAGAACRPNTEAFDAGADIWAMLSVIQRD
jgi:hypothetical protein